MRSAGNRKNASPPVTDDVVTSVLDADKEQRTLPVMRGVPVPRRTTSPEKFVDVYTFRDSAPRRTISTRTSRRNTFQHFAVAESMPGKLKRRNGHDSSCCFWITPTKMWLARAIISLADISEELNTRPGPHPINSRNAAATMNRTRSIHFIGHQS